nr:MAG TPA: hypothetical protein [Caudoviricetes sp.]
MVIKYPFENGTCREMGAILLQKHNISLHKYIDIW